MLSVQSNHEHSHPHFKQWPRYRQSHIGRKLEWLSIQLMDAYNGHIEMSDYLWQYMSDSITFNSGLPGAEPVRADPKDMLDKMQHFFVSHPSWRVHATNPSSVVDEESGEAVVFTSSTINGFMTDLARERVTKTKWKRTCGQWKLIEHEVLVGGGLPPATYD